MTPAAADSPSPRPPERTRPLRRSLAVLFGLLAIRVAMVPSANPAILGLYSRGWFAFQVFDLIVLGLLLAPRLGRPARLLGCLGVVAATFGATSNDAVASIPNLPVGLALLRLLAGLTAIGIEFDNRRTRAGRALPVALLLGSVLIPFSLLDLGLWGISRVRSGSEREYRGFRDDYDLARVGPDDILLVGDSFVWGDGVSRDARMGNRLERLLSEHRPGGRVYSLGVRSAGPARYIESLERVPAGRKAREVIFSFYPNDIEPRPRSRATARALDLTWSLGRSSPTFRLAHDVLAKLDIPSVAAYHASVVEDHDAADPTHERRWNDLTDALRRFKAAAAERSDAPPILMLIPLMVDFRSYPIPDVHARVAQAGAAMGYDVLDLLPPFRETLVDGDRYRVGPADNHFNAVVHDLVARLLRDRLER